MKTGLEAILFVGYSFEAEDFLQSVAARGEQGRAATLWAREEWSEGFS